MFERFSEDARKVVVGAQEEAQHGEIGTGHLLLGLSRAEEGVAGRALASLEVALRETLRLGRHWVGAEHILLGIAEGGEGTAARILDELDAGPERVRREVLRLVPAPKRRVRSGDGRVPRRGSPESVECPRTMVDGAARQIDTVAREVPEQLGRPPDAGDLLVTLACLGDGLAARTLARLGIDADSLARAAGARARRRARFHLRSSSPRSSVCATRRRRRSRQRTSRPRPVDAKPSVAW